MKLWRMLKRFWKPKPVFHVQMHVVRPSKDGGKHECVYSYGVIVAHSRNEADRVAGELYASNRWGNADQWPLVTVAEQ